MLSSALCGQVFHKGWQFWEMKELVPSADVAKVQNSSVAVFPHCSKVWNMVWSFVKPDCSKMLRTLYLERKKNVVNDRGPSGFLCLCKGISFTSPSAFINHSSQVQTAVLILMCQCCLRHKGSTSICDSNVEIRRRPATTVELSCSSNKLYAHTYLNYIKKTFKLYLSPEPHRLIPVDLTAPSCWNLQLKI